MGDAPVNWDERRALRWMVVTGSFISLFALALLCVVLAVVVLQFVPLFVEAGPAVAVVRVEGVIGSTDGDLFSGPGVRSDEVVKRLDELKEHRDVRAVVVRINSPGGGVVASDEIRAAVLRVRASGKPVVASMGELAASGGYYIAAATDRILANPQTTTGSIGVLAVIPVVEGLLDRIGIEVEVVKSGPLKGSGSGFAPLGDAERAILQDLIDGAYEQFVAVVAEGRKLDEPRVRELADGRVYSGQQALQLGLVDEMGNLPEAIDRAAELAGLGEKPRIIEDRRRSLPETLFSARALGAPSPAGVAAGLAVDRTAPLQYLYLGTGR